MRKLIVGIDPGTTTAVALLDIDSSFYEVTSRKDFSFSAVCDYIVSRGDPLIVATDKRATPDFVKKIASTFGARIYEPEENLTVEEKENITKKFAKQTASSVFANDHEQDALAAAIYAKKKFSSFLEKIDKILERKGFEGNKGDVKELLIKKEASNIEQALKLLEPVQKGEARIVSRLVDSRSVLELRRRYGHLQKENEALKKKAAELEGKIKNLEEELRWKEKAKRETKAKKTRHESSSKIPALTNLEKDHYVLVEYEPGADVKDRIVIVDRKADIKSVAKKLPKAIISETFQKSFIKTEDVDVPVLVKDSIAIKSIDGFLVAEKTAVDDAIKKNFISWLRDYKQRYEEK